MTHCYGPKCEYIRNGFHGNGCYRPKKLLFHDNSCNINYLLNTSMATVTITSKPSSPYQPCVVLLSNMMQLVIMKLWV